MKPSRIEALADAIFAIVMTLLVLELRVPELHGSEHVAEELLHALGELWPKFLSYAVSFFLIALFWNSHHVQFTKIKRADIGLVWINIALFMFISLLPFSTAFLGEYPFAQVAQVFYGLNLLICALFMAQIWQYAANNYRLIDKEDISMELRINVFHKMTVPPLLYLLAIAVSFFNTQVSLFLFALGPIVYSLPVDTRLWRWIVAPAQRKHGVTPS